MILHLIVGLIKKTLYKISQYFSEPYELFGGDINVKVHLFNYATKIDLKKATGVDTSILAAKSDWASTDKLKTIPVNLSKVSNVANNNVDKKTPTLYDKLVAKVNNNDTSRFALYTVQINYIWYR